MGAHEKTKFIGRLNRWRLKKSPWKVAFLLFLWLIAIMSDVKAQGDLKNNGGTITNTGKIRIKGQALGLPANINGILEYFGANQTIPAVNYNNLQLTGSGNNNSSGGNFSVNGDLTIGASAQLNVPAPNVISLNGNIVEQGYLSGSIQKTIDLTSIPSSDFGGMGATLSWSGSSPGLTTVKRTSGISLFGEAPTYIANQSIKRYYDIALSSTGFNGTFVFRYHDLELNGQNENTLELWRTSDNGVTWRRQGGTVNSTTKTITKTGILSFSKWTASDAIHPLGPLALEWVAQNLGGTSGGGQSGPVNTNLGSPFVVTVTDGYGNPMAGTTVTFSITGTPGGASGQSLSAVTVTTNASGQASTTLHLGSASGTYSVAASSGALIGSPVTFTATATGGAPPPVTPIPIAIALTSGNGQIDTVGKKLANLLTVTVVDQFGLPFAGATVNFAIAGTPSGAAGQQLSTVSAVTGANGRVSTEFTLGSRPGTYTVVATSPALTGAFITFSNNAVAGRAAVLAASSGNGQTQVAKTTLAQPFVVSTTDLFGNPAQGVNVKFVITKTPTLAAGYSLTDTLVVTNAQGLAQSTLVLGDSTGLYEVTATSISVPDSQVVFAANAITAPAVLRATSLALTSGNNQTGVVGVQVTNPLTVTVFDQFGAPFAGATITFEIASTPASDGFASLTNASVTTDSTGRASTFLIVGHKAGTYTVSAKSDSLSGSPATFTVNAVAGPVASITPQSGLGQAGEVGTVVTQPFVLSVTDAFGNPVQGVNVLFAITATPTGASGQAMTAVNGTTDALGRASARILLGDKPGMYQITASVSGVAGIRTTFDVSAVVSGSASISKFAGMNQTAPVGTTLSQAFVVRVLNATGNPVSGTTVTFAVDSVPAAASGQSLSVATAMTDVDGLASTVLTLGDKAGVYRVMALSAGLAGSPLFFRATAIPPAGRPTIAYTAGDAQSARILTQLASPLVVTALNADGTLLPGQTIFFSIDSMPAGAVGQLVTPTTVTTDAFGRASVVMKLGSKVGTYRIRATSENLSGSPIEFRVRATVGVGHSLVYMRGDDQVKLVGTTLDAPFVAQLVDIGDNPVPGVQVQFAIDTLPNGAKGQQLSVLSAATDDSGLAATVLTLGDTPGVYKVSASMPGFKPIFFKATAVTSTGAVRIAYTSGNGQSAPVGTQLTSPVVVTVSNIIGVPVAGQQVTFAIDSLPTGATGQTVSPTVVTTDTSGRAAAFVTLGTKSGVYKLTATSDGLVGNPVVFRVRATTGAARSIIAVAGNGQAKMISGTLDSAFVARVVDEFGNPVAGVPVTFSIDSIPTGSTGVKLLVRNSMTDELGQAAAVLTLGTKAGVYVVSAQAGSLTGSPVKFTARATSSAPAAVVMFSGNDQSAPILSTLLAPFVVTVVDIAGNPVEGVGVVFAIDSIPSGAIGQRLKVLNGTTDADGKASAILTLGSREGRYMVLASSSNLIVGSVRFAATATVLTGDVNANSMVDIADLTTVIEHILGKIRLTGIDSVKADFNRDGRIDVVDIVAMQNYLLIISLVNTSIGTLDTDPLLPMGVALAAGHSTTDVKGELVIAENSVRFNMTNAIPVKGAQLIVRFKPGVSIARPDVIFDRARVDSFYYNISGNEMRIVAYNMRNAAIPAGDGPLFRLPMKLSDTSSIESAQLIVSKTDNAVIYDQALALTVTVRKALQGEIPASFILFQNYPNPFNERTKIDYEIADATSQVNVIVQVFNTLGQKVKTLASGRHAGGRFTVVWDGTDDSGNKLSSGSYYYRLISGSFISSKKMIMLK